MTGHRTEPGDVDESHPSSSSELPSRQSPARRSSVGRPPTADADADEPALPTRAAEDTDIGWGADSGERDDRTDDWYFSERPPHH